MQSSHLDGIRASLLRPATWTSGAKQGIGTAYHDGYSQSQSNVWFTLGEGALTEVYYPDISCANLRALELAVSDGHSFMHVESAIMSHEVKLLYEDALVYRQTNTAPDRGYTIRKEYVADPHRHAVHIDVEFTVDRGALRDYQLFVLNHHAVGGVTWQNQVEVVHRGERRFLLASRDDTAVCVYSSQPWVGYALSGQALAEGEVQDVERILIGDSRNELPSHPGAEFHLARVNLAQVGDRKTIRFRLVVAFGQSVDDAIAMAEDAATEPFAEVVQSARASWRPFLEALHPPETSHRLLYYASAMILKAHEDKLHPGAVVASLSIPWGQAVDASSWIAGGYHLVWPRDLYQIASSLAAVGDSAMAHRALRYLQEVLQRQDGSFPQNAWPDGRTYWSGLQLDQVAFPILLAHYVGSGKEYYSMIRRAADFLVCHGPYTHQDRWEENAGYSPSTLAAVVAGLVAAADISGELGQYGSAAVYLAAADELNRQLDEWVTARAGLLSDSPYFVRISDTIRPDDGHFVELKNGGGYHRKSSIVDAGFLELVRLGLRAPDDPRIVESLKVIDETILVESPLGPLWYRYNHDGYGETEDGEPYTGAGRGRLWPLLSGERGEYEVALAAVSTKNLPRTFGTDVLLDTMARCANDGSLIAEQVWDRTDILHKGLQAWHGTGSATPLAWAHAQFLRLCECVRQARVVETPDVVVSRYAVDASLMDGPRVRIEQPVVGFQPIHLSQPFLTVRGTTDPGATVAFLVGGRYFAAHSDQSGKFRCMLEFRMAGVNEVTVIGYDNRRDIWLDALFVLYRPQVLYHAENANPLSRGQGLFEYPKHPDFRPGDFSLRSVTVSSDEGYVYFEVELGNLDDPWGGPSGISKQIIDIYLSDAHAPTGSAQIWTKGLNTRFRDGQGWHRLVRVTGNWHGDARVYHPDWTTAGPIAIAPQYGDHRINVAVSKEELGGTPDSDWGIMVVVAGADGGEARRVRAKADEWSFGGAEDEGMTPYILDFLLPEEHIDALQSVNQWSKFQLPLVGISSAARVDKLTV